MKKLLLTGMVVAFAATGCDELIGPDGSGLGPNEVVELSDGLIQDGLNETSDTTSDTTSSALGDGIALDVRTWSMDFTRTHSCALGGEVTTVGTRERTRDSATRTGTMDLDATRTFTDCARPLDDTAAITLNGELTLTAHREWEAGMWNGAQEVSLQGSLDWATAELESGAEIDTGTCEVAISASFEMATHTRTVTGTVCGEDVSELDGWTFGPMGQGPGMMGGGMGGGGMGG